MRRDTRNQAELGEKVTVMSKKGCVFLNSVGSAPFAVVETKRGLAVVPDAYSATSYSDGEYWRGETHVAANEEGAMVVYYRFISNRCPDIRSDWKLTPTEAYKECNDRLKTGFSGASNGQLIIGVTYPSLQAKIFAVMPEALTLLNQAKSARMSAADSRKRRRRPTAATATTPRRKRVTSFASDSSYESSENASPYTSSQDSDEYGPQDTEISDYLSDNQHQEQEEEETTQEDEEGKMDEPMEDLQMMELNRCFSLHTVSDSSNDQKESSSPLPDSSNVILSIEEDILSELDGPESGATLNHIPSSPRSGYTPHEGFSGASELQANTAGDLLDFLSAVPLDDM